jgi:hypothetical protein
MMIKFLLLPLILVGCTAPVTDPPAHALEVEGGVEQWIYMVEYLKNYQREENMTDPDDAINSALEEFWEVQDGSDGSTEQEKLL